MRDSSFGTRTLKNGVSGTAGGVASCLVGHPFDTLKVRLQTQPTNPPVYRGVVDCFWKTLKWEGVGGLYKGVGSPLAGQMFFRATMYSSYYQVTTLLGQDERPHQRLSQAEYFLCGLYTGLFVSFVECPIDLFKTKVQVQILRSKAGHSVQYTNVFQAGYRIARHHGVRGMYQGLDATLFRNVPSFSIAFGCNEVVRGYFIPDGGSLRDLPGWVHLLSGAVAGFMYWVITYPTDVIKSAMMSDSSDRAQRKFRSIGHCARLLYEKEGGWKRFYRGYLPCMMRSIPANAAMWIAVEKSRSYLG